MIVSVRTRAILALPRLTWRVLKVKAAKTGRARKTEHRVGPVAAFEQMLENQVRIMMSGLDD